MAKKKSNTFSGIILGYDGIPQAIKDAIKSNWGLLALITIVLIGMFYEGKDKLLSMGVGAFVSRMLVLG